MAIDPTDEPRDAATEQLEAFGLSSYAADTFVALASLGTGTAREVSQLSTVPRTRVYDAVEELREQGLVDVQQSTPKEFWAISAGTASRTYRRDLEHRADVLEDALTELEPEQRRVEQRGVWTVEGQPAVTERVLEFVGDAEDEIVYMTVEGLLTEDLVDALAEAAERGVSIELAGSSPAVEERIRNRIPQAATFETLWDWSEIPAGRLVMVDEQTTLVSALANGHDAAAEDPRSETAIWGEGEHNSLVVVLQAMFTGGLRSS
jgi:sugar-specific transcriptional regulator TrmB